ncbi:unnamed protein product [Vitrella brassicaformis CCMP3155]|uniref:SCP domain-containing protein n=1 Tax=Vitrella brassicaformis (strain CCMP3155) TaxID=1169540 RepID=A0A0G4EXR8_VITBC|nr:unnamed protein product [Vitrella brassicaformis CCMP3155]|eukprot:CEM03195.1 unnamed protein product [Vitrella brassicaformis CCMP3155]
MIRAVAVIALLAVSLADVHGTSDHHEATSVRKGALLLEINAKRLKHGVSEVFWSDFLAREADEYAAFLAQEKECRAVKRGRYGELVLTTKGPTEELVIDSWYDKGFESWNFRTNQFTSLQPDFDGFPQVCHFWPPATGPSDYSLNVMPPRKEFSFAKDAINSVDAAAAYAMMKQSPLMRGRLLKAMAR